MTGARVIEALLFHDRQIVNGTSPSKPIEPERRQEAASVRGQLAHLRWMIAEAIGFVDAGKLDKAMRWLGFIQGVLWVLGLSTIEESKRANMPPGETFQP